MPDQWFYVDASGNTIGPVSSKILKQLVDNGVILPTTILISEDGTKEFEAGRSSLLFNEPSGSANTSHTRSLTPIPTGKTLPLAPNRSIGAPTVSTTCPTPPAPEMPMTGASPFDAGIPMPITLRSDGDRIVRVKQGFGFGDATTWAIVSVGVLFLIGSFLVSFSWQMAVRRTNEMENQLPKYEEKAQAPRRAQKNPGVVEVADAGKKETLEEIAARAEMSIAQIDGPVSCGTGFVVDAGIIVTNSHVIASEKIESLRILFPAQDGAKQGPHKPQLLYEDTVRDIALLGIEEKSIPSLPVYPDYVFRRAQRILTIGNPGRGDGVVLENAVSAGILSTQTKLDGLPFFQLSIAVNPGNAGGPVLDEDGRVIGMITLKSVKGPSMAFSIPVGDLENALELEKNLTAMERKEMNDAHLAVAGLRQGLERMANESVFGDSNRDLRGANGNAMVESRQLWSDSDETVPGSGLFPSTGELQPDVPFSEMSEADQERLMNRHREDRYQQVLAKKTWTFNGAPLHGHIVGFKNGIVYIRLEDSADDEPPLERYARRFSASDINDILFYARYHGIPTGNLGRR